MSSLRRAFQFIADLEQSNANRDARTTARLCEVVVQVAAGMSGSRRAPKLTAKDFLPFPEWRPATEDADGPDQPTRFVLSELGKQRLIPLHVLVALMTAPQSQP